MMAMFLARIKKILNLGTKSITANGTYNASTDGYDGFSSVTVNVPTVTPTSITPSNSSPVALTANTAVTPTRAGYAIASYYSLTPAPAGSSPEGFAAGIIKMNTSGYAVRAYSTVTPSDSNPPQLYENYLYFMNHSGYLYETQHTTPTSITPTNIPPVALTANTPVTPSRNGFAIQDYASSSKSPSASGTQVSWGWNYINNSGYLYTNQLTETTLWTNSSPSSSLAGGDVTLSQSITDFDLLKFEYNYSTSDTTNIITYVDVATYRANSKSASGTAGKGINPSCLIYTGSANYQRTCYYTSDTKTYIGACGRVGGSGTSNTNCILKYIKGVKLP